MSNNINHVALNSNNNTSNSIHILGSSPIVFAINKIKTLNEAIEREVKQKGSVKSFLKAADLNKLMPAISKILEVCDAETAMPLLAVLTTKEVLNNYSTYVFETLKVFNTSKRLPVFLKALELGRAREKHGENAINYNNLLFPPGNTENLKLPKFVHDAINNELQSMEFHNKELNKKSTLLKQCENSEKINIFQLRTAYLHALTKENDKKSDTREINRAIETGTLNIYLENETSVALGKKIAADPENISYVELLKVCDAEIVRHILSALTEHHILKNETLCSHTIKALEVFNTPDRLPVFIQALKLGRGQHKNNIGIVYLILYHNALIRKNPLEKGLPSFVLKALKFEYNHLYLSSKKSLDPEERKILNGLIDEAEVNFAKLITECSLVHRTPANKR